MKQPSINIDNSIYMVRSLEFDLNGILSKVTFLLSDGTLKSIFKEDRIDCPIANVHMSVTETPVNHPYHNYMLSNNIESLII